MPKSSLIAALLFLAGPAGAGVLTLCAEPWQPFIYPDERGRPAGLAVNVLDRVAQAQGHRIRYLFLASGACLRLMHSGRSDVVAFARHENSPSDWLQTQQPLVFWVLNAWVAKDSTQQGFHSLGQFSGRRVAHVEAYDYPRSIAGKQDWQRVVAADTAASMRMLAAGRVEVVFEDAMALSSVTERGVTDRAVFSRVRRLQPAVASVAQPLSLRPGLAQFAAALDAEALRLQQQGQLDTFYQQHFGSSFAHVLSHAE